MQFKPATMTAGLAAAILIAGGPAVAQSSDQGRQNDKAQAREQAQKQNRNMRHTLTGEITNMKQVRVRGQNARNQVIRIETDQGNAAAVDLGRAGGLGDLSLEEGQQVSVTGRFHRVRDRIVLFADRIEADGMSRQIDRPQPTRAQRAQSASAQQPAGAKSEYRVLRGEVVNTKTVDVRDADQPNTVALIRTENDEHVVVDLGAGKSLQGSKLKAGDEVQIRGREAVVGDRVILVGDLMRANGRDVALDRPARRSPQPWQMTATDDGAATSGRGSNASSQSRGEQAVLRLDQKQPFGRYLTDGEGRALYMFMADTKNQSNCQDACARAWPPFYSQQTPRAAGQVVQDDLIGSIRRDDGRQQVTYGGWPLYYYSKDQRAGATSGQDREHSGHAWYLVSPDGHIITASARSGQSRRQASADQSQPSQQSASASSDRNRRIGEITVDGQRVLAGDLIGMEIVSPRGNRIGELVGFIQRRNAKNDMVIKLDKENRQMGVVAGNPQKLQGTAANELVVAGGSTVAIQAGDLTWRNDNRTALVIDPNALTTVNELQPDRLTNQ